MHLKKVIKRSKMLSIGLNSCLLLQSPHILGNYKLKVTAFQSLTALHLKASTDRRISIYLCLTRNHEAVSDIHSWNVHNPKRMKEIFLHRVSRPILTRLPCKELWWTWLLKGPQQNSSRSLPWHILLYDHMKVLSLHLMLAIALRS